MSTSNIEPKPIFKCEICGKVAKGHRSTIYASYPEFMAYPGAVEAWRERHKAELDASPFHMLSLWDDHPDLAKWHVIHDRCVEDIGKTTDRAYWFEVAQADTWGKLAHWTTHLLGKGWFEHTDWAGLLGGAGAYGVNTSGYDTAASA